MIPFFSLHNLCRGKEENEKRGSAGGFKLDGNETAPAQSLLRIIFYVPWVRTHL